MTIVKVSELTNLQLDYFVASIELKGTNWFYNEFDKCINNALGDSYSPSIEWAQGGPIIELGKISVLETGDANKWEGRWWHEANLNFLCVYGPTFLIAAMRCYVASKLGDSVKVPDELI